MLVRVIVPLSQSDLIGLHVVAHGDGAAAAEAVAAVGGHIGGYGAVQVEHFVLCQLVFHKNLLHVVVIGGATLRNGQVIPGTCPVIIATERLIRNAERFIRLSGIGDIASGILDLCGANGGAQVCHALAAADEVDVDRGILADARGGKRAAFVGRLPTAVDEEFFSGRREALFGHVRSDDGMYARVFAVGRRGEGHGTVPGHGQRLGTFQPHQRAIVPVGGPAVGGEIAGHHGDGVVNAVGVVFRLVQGIPFQPDRDLGMSAAVGLHVSIQHSPNLSGRNGSVLAVSDLQPDLERALGGAVRIFGGGNRRHLPAAVPGQIRGRGYLGGAVRLDIEGDDLAGHIRVTLRGRDLFDVIGVARQQTRGVLPAVRCREKVGLVAPQIPKLGRHRAVGIGEHAEGDIALNVVVGIAVHLVELQRVAGRKVEVDGAVGLGRAALQIVDGHLVIALWEGEGLGVDGPRSGYIGHDSLGVIDLRRARADDRARALRKVDLAIDLAVDAAHVEIELIVHIDPHVVVAGELKHHVVALDGAVAIAVVVMIARRVRQEEVDFRLHAEPVVGLAVGFVKAVVALPIIERQEIGAVVAALAQRLIGAVRIIVHIEPAVGLVEGCGVFVAVVVVIARVCVIQIEIVGLACIALSQTAFCVEQVVPETARVQDALIYIACIIAAVAGGFAVLVFKGILAADGAQRAHVARYSRNEQEIPGAFADHLPILIVAQSVDARAEGTAEGCRFRVVVII